MKNALTRMLSAATLQMLTVVPFLFVITRWQYSHLRRVDAERRIDWTEFAAAGATVWFLTALVASAVAVWLVKPLHRWMGVAKGAAAEGDDEPKPPSDDRRGDLRARTV